MARSNKLTASNIPAPITGVPTEAKKASVRAKAAAKPKGGKPGQAMANQSAQYSSTPAKPKNNDKITNVQTAKGAKEDTLVLVAGSANVLLPISRMSAELKKIAIVGGSLKAVSAYLAAHKPQAKLAHGITGRDAPHSAAAAAESRSAKPAAPAAPKTPAKARTVARQPKDAFSYTPTSKSTADRKAGTWTRFMLDTIVAHKDTASAIAAHAKSNQYSEKKLHFSWARDNGYISY